MSQKASGYERIDGDAYFTPAWVTEALLSVEQFPDGACDPACGAGHIVEVVRRAGAPALGIDIKRYEPLAADPPLALLYAERDLHAGGDFLRCTVSPLKNLITNPPYGQRGALAVDFIKRALELTRPLGGKVAMLLRVDFDSAAGRRGIFDDHPAFAAKYTLTKRIRWANIEQKDSGPTENHAWFVWSWGRRPNEARYYGYLPRAKATQ